MGCRNTRSTSRDALPRPAARAVCLLPAPRGHFFQKGMMMTDRWEMYGDWPEDAVVCDRCDGDGWIMWGDDVIEEEATCPVCFGEGWITRRAGNLKGKE